MKITIPYEWSPREYQKEAWAHLVSGGKRTVLNFHRRAGKDELCLHYTAVAAHERVANYWHCMPEYSQARKAMWDGINSHSGKRRIDEVFPQEVRARTLEQEMKIIFKNGSSWQLVGSDNPNSLVGSPPLGIVFSEYALSSPTAFGYLRPILLENGGWAIFNSTPRGKNHFHALCKYAEKAPDWFYQVLTVDQTNAFTQFQLESELREMQVEHGEQYGRSLWHQEYFCSFDAAIPGSIWGDCVERAESEGRICEFDIDTSRPVDTGFDLGRTDNTSIWFRQIVGREINIIDHHTSNGKDIDFYVTLLLDKQKQYGLKYGTHWLPHDARPRTLAAGGKSILQQFHDAAKRNPELGRFAICPRLDKQEGIQAARKTFPYCRFHSIRCAEGIEALRNYHREWDADLRVFKDNPLHDWSSDSADAFRYLSLTWKFTNPKAPQSTLEDNLHKGSIRAQNFGDLKAALFQRKARERAELH